MDVLAVTIAVPHAIRIMARQKSPDNAEAFINMAVLRRGVDTEFYVMVPDGTYEEGEKWIGRKLPATSPQTPVGPGQEEVKT